MAGNAMTIEAQARPADAAQPTAAPHPSSVLHPPLSTSTWLQLILPALTSSGLLWLSYFPANCGWLGWVALLPLLFLVRSTASPWRIYFAAWISGLAFYFPVLQWLRVADPMMYYTWAALATYCSLYVPLGIWLVRRLDRGTRLPLVVTVPAVWTALEFFRANFMGDFATAILGHTQHDYPEGFTWYFLGHTQHDFLQAIQIADLGGAYAVTFVVAAVNALVFGILSGWATFRRWLPLDRPWSPARQFAAIVLILGGTIAYGQWRLGQADFAPGPRLALIQGNLEQRIRNAAAGEGGDQVANRMFSHHLELCYQAAVLTPRPDLIVWPETSCPGSWPLLAANTDVDKLPAEFRKLLEDDEKFARKHFAACRTDILIGTETEVLGADASKRFYNSALLVRSGGRVGERYDKIHRIPFGEYVPLRNALPWLNTFAPYDYEYSVQPGDAWTRLSLEKYRFGVMICYEDTDPMLARQYVRSEHGGPVDFLINISNDGWFDGTAEHEQHLAICRFRAVECRRAVARAVNMGISAVIDGNGRIVALPRETWSESKKIKDVLVAQVPIDSRSSLYAAWGDWLPAGCWLFLGVSFIGPIGRRLYSRNRPATTSD